MHTLELPLRKIGNVELIPGPTGGQLAANSLWIAEAGLLIDTGADRALLESLKPSVRHVIYTHYHSDHRWHGELFQDAETWTHSLDAPPLTSIEGMVDSVAADESNRALLTAWFSANVKPLRVDRFFEGQNECSFEQFRLVPLHMPGHTPGLLCPYFPEEKLLFLTDYDLTKFGPWYGNAGSDLDAFEESLRRIERFEADWYMTSHLPGAIRREEMLALLAPYAAQIPRRDERIVELLAEPKTVIELSTVGICYQAKHLQRDPFLQWFEKVQLEHHLKRLAKRGKVVLDGERWRQQ